MDDDLRSTMMSDSEAQPLFDMFSPASYEEWRQAAEKTLKGVPFEKRLITRTYESINLQPIYNAADIAALPQVQSLPGMPPYLRGAQALGSVVHAWEVAQELPYPTAGEVNQAACADLTRGLTALRVPLDRATLHGLDPDAAPATLVGAGGVSLASVADLNALFNDIALDQTPLMLAAGANALPLAALALVAAERRHIAHDQLYGWIAMDPLGALAAQGTPLLGLERGYEIMARLTAWAQTHAPRLRTMLVDMQPYHNGGATAVQDLAYALATGVAYLRAMNERGVPVEVAAPRMQFSFSIGANFFMEIARLRAARMLWARVVAAFGGGEAAQKMYIHGRTSAWTKARFDAYNNMLRATSEAMAGVMGGCDSLHISPFDEAVGLPDEFSRRIARNVQIMLRQECNFARLVDPAGGAWAVETLSDEIARKAWELFQEIERAGGMAAALTTGTPQAAIAKTRAERFSQVAQRRDVIIGVNMYANLKEQPLFARGVDHTALQARRAAEMQAARQASGSDRRQAALTALTQTLSATPERLVEAALEAARAGATLGELAAALANGDTPGTAVTPVPAHRAAEQFETLRDAAEQHARRTGARPAVFLANMGPIPQHKARADFSAGFFEAGGFAVIGNDGFATVEAAAQAALASGAAIVTICSTDETYLEIVPALTGRLKAERPDLTVVLAGYPADQVDAHRAAGVDEFIHLRADCYATLARLQQLKGVSA